MLAARIGDDHKCVCHGGGFIITGEPTVLIEFMPAARVTDLTACAVDPIAKGSLTVLTGNLLAARLLDETAHGGKIITSALTVDIGG